MIFLYLYLSFPQQMLATSNKLLFITMQLAKTFRNVPKLYNCKSYDEIQYCFPIIKLRSIVFHKNLQHNSLKRKYRRSTRYDISTAVFITLYLKLSDSKNFIILFLERDDTCKQIINYIGIVTEFHNCTRERERETDRQRSGYRANCPYIPWVHTSNRYNII